MAEKQTEQLIKEQMESLPRPVKEAIASFDWARAVFDIGRKHDLHVDEIGEVQTEVMLVVLGLISPKDFYDQMVSRVGIEENRALEVATEVNEKVFLRIRDFMKEYYAEEEKSQSERKVLNSAGIRLDDGEDLPEEVLPKVSIEDTKNKEIVDEEEKMVAPPIEVAKNMNNTESKEESELKEKLNKAKDFTDAPTNYFDPYREPVE